MKFGINLTLVLFFLTFPPAVNANTFEEILRKAAVESGFLPPDHLYDDRDEHLVTLGERLFASKHVSLNGNISCKTCHLREFNSADGIPNAVGIGGIGRGHERLAGGGRIIPRNTLPLWGRGGRGFNTFFWDGKVDFADDSQISQFGSEAPSTDPLVVAIHLPTIEIGEMLNEDAIVKQFKTESTKSASRVYELIVDRIRKNEKILFAELLKKIDKQESDIQFVDIARAMAAFIRSEFRIRKTKFSNFVFDGGKLSEVELKGGLVFYGKGKCANCHGGPYLTDFEYHVIPIPQLGFGKNGFGIDYGRFNVTLEPRDLFKFRTPSLFNTTKAAPYGHSGSVATLQEVIRYHFDPLRFEIIEEMDKLARHEYYKRLSLGSENILYIGYLEDEEVEYLVQFLKTLHFE